MSRPMSQLVSQPISQIMSRHISLTSDPILPSSTFVNVLIKAIEAYESRTREDFPTHLAFLRDCNSLEAFRSVIQAQARNFSARFLKRNLSLINRLVTSLFFFPYASMLTSLSNIDFVADGVPFDRLDVCTPFAISNLLFVIPEPQTRVKEQTHNGFLQSHRKLHHAI